GTVDAVQKNGTWSAKRISVTSKISKTINKSKKKSRKKKGSKKNSLPKKYDSRKHGVITPVRDQGVTGCCWAFAAAKSMEADLIKKKMLKRSAADLSVSDLVWFAYHMPNEKTDPLYGEGMQSTQTRVYENDFPFRPFADRNDDIDLSDFFTGRPVSEPVYKTLAPKKRASGGVLAAAKEASGGGILAPTKEVSGGALSPAKEASSGQAVYPAEGTPGGGALTPANEAPGGGDAYAGHEDNNSDVKTDIPTRPAVEIQKPSVDTQAYMNGGSALMSVFELARWSGVAYDSLIPFKADNMTDVQNMADTLYASGDKYRYLSEFHLQNAECYDHSSMKEIKKAVMKHGALNISIYYDPAYVGFTGSHGYSYYQTAHTGDNAPDKANHSVTLIGWNDNYSRNNFLEDPGKKGAFLIANSYGKGDGDNGYFWLSYQEASICDIYSYDMEPPANYDHNYQYDGFGWGDFLVSKNSFTTANVFTVPDGASQILNAVSFYTVGDNENCRVSIMTDLNGDSPSSGTEVKGAGQKKKILRSGYHTLKLKKPVVLSPGEKFAVCVTYGKLSGQAAAAPIEGADVTSSGLIFSYTSKKGQSWVNYYGNWYDLNRLGYNNACIKAFTDDI
ncbi:MAG: lectin like domain-containing protein, partial [Lachnospiraceae bacterium]|nr:lectin like domain-containing protein [Lachnospiraceae bacterium]